MGSPQSWGCRAAPRTEGPGRRRKKGVWVILSKPPLFERFSQDPWIRERAVFEKNFGRGNLLLYVIVPERQFPLPAGAGIGEG